MRIYFVRHGQSQGNVHFTPGVIRPKTDPLTELGQKQAQQAAILLKSQHIKPTIIVSSPYTRAIDTANIIKDELGIALIEDERLGEYNPGDWDGVHIDELTERFNKLPAEERYTFRPPHGESWLDEAQRVKQAIEQVHREHHDDIVIVTHYDPLKAVINLLTKQPSNLWDAPASYPPASVTILDRNSGDWIVRVIQP